MKGWEIARVSSQTQRLFNIHKYCISCFDHIPLDSIKIALSIICFMKHYEDRKTNYMIKFGKLATSKSKPKKLLNCRRVMCVAAHVIGVCSTHIYKRGDSSKESNDKSIFLKK